MVLLVGGSARSMPGRAGEWSQSLTGKVPARNVNPDECVATGRGAAGWQARRRRNGMVVSSAAQNVILMDVTPLSLSIETVGGVATKDHRPQHDHPDPSQPDFFHRCAVPDGRGYQSSARRTVSYARDNKLLGNFRLKRHSSRAMAGVPQIEVTFAIDANGIVDRLRERLGHGQPAGNHHFLDHQYERRRNPPRHGGSPSI